MVEDVTGTGQWVSPQVPVTETRGVLSVGVTGDHTNGTCPSASVAEH